MDILVAGGHGKIAQRLLGLLATKGHHARGLIRNPGQATDLEALGAVAVLGDLEADADLAEYVQGADHYTIVRPGSLTDDPGTGRVHVSTELGSRGEVPRDDVAAVIAEVLDAPNTTGVTFEVFSGRRPGGRSRPVALTAASRPE
jgi:uncharacterized protein YbjT (DUF2867 family)